MINKEIILGNGNIVKDFSDRNIPQNSHNQVCVSFLIPSNQFNDYDDYSVFTAVSRKVGNTTTPLNALVLTASKSITIEGINYIKFSCVLSIDYTNVLGELYFSPYVQATKHTDLIEDADEETEDIEVEVKQLLSQSGFTNCKLNIIKAIRIQEDASVEDLSIASTLASQINSKKIYYNATWNDISVGNANTLYYNIATSYNPSVALYNGSIVAVKNQNVVSFYFPYLNGANTELLLMTNDGLFYKISSISRTLVDEGLESEHYEYSATKTQLTYSKSEIDTALNLKADKSIKINGYDLSQDRTLTKGDVGLGNVANYGVETSQPTASGDQLYITSKAVYDALQLVYTAISGCATDDDLTTINNRLDSIEAIIGSDDGDADSVINTLKEVIVVLNGLGEGASLLNLINAKANQSDFDTLNSQINGTNGIATKVSFLYDSNANAYAEIKAQSGTIDILTTDWVANTGDANYPYKWELSNGYLVGASYVSVVFDKDSDTSMLSATIGIDDENGKVILYASELPSATISIQLIAIFNSVNAYQLYNQTLINQVASNTSAISDINNTKLPLYELKQESLGSGNGTKLFTIVGSAYIQQVKLGSGASARRSRFILSKDFAEMEYLAGDSSQYNAYIKLLKEANDDRAYIEMETKDHTLKLDSNGLTLDGNNIDNRLLTTTTAPTESGGVITISTSDIVESGAKVNDYLLYVDSGNASALYKIASISSGTATLTLVGGFSSGGGGQEYQHVINITYVNTQSNVFIRLSMVIKTTNSTPFTHASLCQWLYDNGFYAGSGAGYSASGGFRISNQYASIDGVQRAGSNPYTIRPWGMSSDGTAIYGDIFDNQYLTTFVDKVL